jgi:hypothetical protein
MLFEDGTVGGCQPRKFHMKESKVPLLDAILGRCGNRTGKSMVTVEVRVELAVHVVSERTLDFTVGFELPVA